MGQEGVVGPDHGAVYVGILDAFEEPAGEHRREQHLGIDAVEILFPKALLGGTGSFSRAAVGVEVGAAGELDLVAPGDVLAVAKQGLALDQPALSSFGQVDQSGRPVLPPLGDVLHKYIGRRLHMPISADYLVLSAHGRSLFGSATG